jgi:aminoglycoside 6-adenylyltransferase
MRSEAEMIDLILNTAKSDDRVRAVTLNGSRANPNAPRDKYQDYDIVYFVRDLPSFESDPAWVDLFGKRIMLQMPESMRDPIGDGHITYLMLFEDGTRIDLSLIPLEKFDELLDHDSETIPLLDKDGILPQFPTASDEDYHVKPPSKLFYDSACNNFWWCCQNVAKGVCRDELPYALGMLNDVLRVELHHAIEWRIGIDTNFKASAGKMGKYFGRYLSDRHYGMYKVTYPAARAASIWNALFVMCDLFRELAVEAGAHFGFDYPMADDNAMRLYLEGLRAESDKK